MIPSIELDIKTGVQTAILLALFFGLIFLYMGYRTVKSGRKLPYFRKRRDMLVRGWRLIFIALGMGVFSAVINFAAEPIAYRFYPPSPTVTLTPTITITPTISTTPTITPTITITNTPSITNTPAVPDQVLSQFESTITPAPDYIFSPMQFARDLDETWQLVEPGTEFANPVQKIVGLFSYDLMTTGAQWTALWYRNGELVYYETLPWNGGTGGYGFTEWEPNSEEWLPGTYQVQIFIGTEWVTTAGGSFIITGAPPTSTPTIAPSATLSPTPTQTATRTIGPSPTPSPSLTRTFTITPTITLTRTVTITPTITRTPTVTQTRLPTMTVTITKTITITRTLRPTDTKRPTLTPVPFRDTITPRP